MLTDFCAVLSKRGDRPTCEQRRARRRACKPLAAQFRKHGSCCASLCTQTCTKGGAIDDVVLYEGRRQVQRTASELATQKKTSGASATDKTNNMKTSNKPSTWTCCASAKLSFQHRDSSRQTPPRHAADTVACGCSQMCCCQPASAQTRSTRLADRWKRAHPPPRRATRTVDRCGDAAAAPPPHSPRSLPH